MAVLHEKQVHKNKSCMISHEDIVLPANMDMEIWKQKCFFQVYQRLPRRNFLSIICTGRFQTALCQVKLSTREDGFKSSAFRVLLLALDI